MDIARRILRGSKNDHAASERETHDGRRHLFGFLEFQTLFGAGDPRAGWFCYDGTLDIFDFLGFLNAFGIGCP